MARHLTPGEPVAHDKQLVVVRPLRLEMPGALWHVTSRGNERRSIFRDDDDRRLFQRLLAAGVRRFRWRLHAYVLMGNHYHLLLETPEPNLSCGMHWINSTYAQKFNSRHERVGHLVQGRFKAILVEKERHLLELVRYVVLNPVRAGLARSAGDWRWSNYRATAGLAPNPRWLEVDWTRSQFGSDLQARHAYQEFVSAGVGLPEPWKRVVGQLFLGSDAFRRRIRAIQTATPRRAGVPLDQHRAMRPALSEIVRVSASVLGVDPGELRERRRSAYRLVVAYLARRDALVRLVDLGSLLGVSVTSAHEIVASARRLSRLEPEFRRLLRRVRSEIRKIEA
jgi:putative transposase